MPNNRQLQEKMCEGLEATTYNKFFSIAVGEENYLSLIIQVLSAIFSPAGICSVVSGVLPQEAGPTSQLSFITTSGARHSRGYRHSLAGWL